ncbi:hypothetical protein L1987_58664 [Smallanthus sonchifolius]|uniref:Uncharacterized protein n=1 Tax=Smallanthus sonchifolius TaxID=185202 RepID=A0ACB9D397_9ASTR|nr:hypothetical protein L1987_58664 [Smallanthus sonchifolius]
MNPSIGGDSPQFPPPKPPIPPDPRSIAPIAASGGTDLLVNKVVTAGNPIVEANGCSISGEGAPGGDPRDSVSSLPDPLVSPGGPIAGEYTRRETRSSRRTPHHRHNSPYGGGKAGGAVRGKEARATRKDLDQNRQSVSPVAVQIGQMEVDIPSGAVAKPVPSSHHEPSLPKSPGVVVLDNPKVWSYAEKCKGASNPAGLNLQYIPPFITPAVPTGPSVKGGNPPVIVPDEDGFTTVNRKGKNKAIKLQKKKKPVVVRANSTGLKDNQRGSTSKGAVSNQVGGQNCSNLASSGFNFARAINGANAKPNKLPNPATVTSSQPPRSLSRAASRNPLNSGSSMEVDPPPICSSNRFAALNEVLEQNLVDQSFATGTNFAEVDLHASLKCTSLVEVSPDLYPHEPMNEDVSPSAQVRTAVNEQAAANCVPQTEKVVCHLNREHSEGARLLPASILSSPSPGGTHTNGGGRSYGISDSQRKAIADRISVSNSICSEETVNWCPREWDYFNDLCISLGLDPDYCIEDVESDTENGTVQFLSDLLNSGLPKSNRK